jgi:hypothetical protein
MAWGFGGPAFAGPRVTGVLSRESIYLLERLEDPRVSYTSGRSRLPVRPSLRKSTVLRCHDPMRPASTGAETPPSVGRDSIPARPAVLTRPDLTPSFQLLMDQIHLAPDAVADLRTPPSIVVTIFSESPTKAAWLRRITGPGTECGLVVAVFASANDPPSNIVILRSRRVTTGLCQGGLAARSLPIAGPLSGSLSCCSIRKRSRFTPPCRDAR